METEEYESFGVIPIFKVEDSDPLFCLVHHASGHWGFPKGHPNKGESQNETALRELHEETGITDCGILGEKVFIEKYSFKKGETDHIKTVKYFLGIAPLKEVQTPVEFKQEIPESKWLPYTEARDLMTFSESKTILDQAF
jgi:8-oxo-dGTP pyrophosphatase MutT (NUDIX family)